MANIVTRLFISVTSPSGPPLPKGEVIAVNSKTPSFYKGGLGRIYANICFFVFKRTLSTNKNAPKDGSAPCVAKACFASRERVRKSDRMYGFAR